jgi:hypothetical protein
MPQPLPSGSTPIVLVVPHPLPSWNALLGLEHWGRAKLKKQIQESFLSALRHAAADCSTRTTSQRSTMSIAADTLASFQATQQAKRALRRAKKKLGAKKTSAP